MVQTCLDILGTPVWLFRNGWTWADQWHSALNSTHLWRRQKVWSTQLNIPLILPISFQASVLPRKKKKHLRGHELYLHSLWWCEGQPIKIAETYLTHTHSVIDLVVLLPTPQHWAWGHLSLPKPSLANTNMLVCNTQTHTLTLQDALVTKHMQHCIYHRTKAKGTLAATLP